MYAKDLSEPLTMVWKVNFLNPVAVGCPDFFV